MHILAYCYNWQPDVLWKLPRQERILWTEMVMAQKEAENKEVSKDSNTEKGYKESS